MRHLIDFGDMSRAEWESLYSLAGHHLDGVLQALALGRGGGTGVGETEHRPAQAEHGRLEGEIGAGGGLIEHGSHHLAPAGVEILLRRGLSPP